jgi:hypothetical protein
MLFFRLFCQTGAFWLAVLATGCSDSSEVGKVVPVEGRVTLDTKPLPGGAVIFNPDVTKNNTLKFIPSGKIQADGKYTVNTGNKVGVPPGAYKVTIFVNAPGAPTIPMKVDPRYASAETTPFAIEVTESPQEGAYDLKLTK